NGATNSDQREVVGGGGGRCLGKSDRSRGAGIERTYRRSKKRTRDRIHCRPKHLWGTASLLGAPGRFQQEVRTECTYQFYGGNAQTRAGAPQQSPNPNQPTNNPQHKGGRRSSDNAHLGPPATQAELHNEGLLERVDYSSLFPWVTKGMEILPGETVLVYTSLQGILYNSNLLPKEQTPKKYEDL